MEQNPKEQNPGERDPVGQAEKDQSEKTASRRRRRKTLGEQANVARIAWVTVCCLALFACGVYMGLASAWENAPPVLTPDYTIPSGIGGQGDSGTSSTDPPPVVPSGEESPQGPGEGASGEPNKPDGSAQSSEGPAEGTEDATETLALVVDLGDLAWPCFGEITEEPGWFYAEDLGEWHYLSGVRITGESRRDVRASLPGTVLAIETDPLWGKVMVVDHGSGIVTDYGGIDVPAFRVGDQVSQGETIANLFGQALTFRIIKNGDPENPADYLTQAR